MALTTSRNSPSVSTVSGKVTIFRIKPSVAFSSPMMMTAISAAPRPVILKPGTRRATSSSTSALSSQWRSNPTIASR